MGYQIGNVCYADKQDAENAHFSQVLPVLTVDGKILQMNYQGGQWAYNGVAVHADFPQCDQRRNIEDGMLLGWLVFAIAASVWGLRILVNRLRVR